MMTSMDQSKSAEKRARGFGPNQSTTRSLGKLGEKVLIFSRKDCTACHTVEKGQPRKHTISNGVQTEQVIFKNYV